MGKKKLLILDNALDHNLYQPVNHWSELTDIHPDVIHVPGGGVFPDSDTYSHIIITGCEGTITNLPPWAEEEARWVVEAISAGSAILGSCWGHQLLAYALVGPQAVRRAAIPECGWLDFKVKNSGSLFPFNSFRAFTVHFDEVVPDCHPELQVLSSTQECPVQIARWGNRPVWGLQPHPEMNPVTAKLFLNRCIEQWPDRAASFRKGLESEVRDSGSGREILNRFLFNAD